MSPPSGVERQESRGYVTDVLTDLIRNPQEPGYAAAARRRAEQPPPPAWRSALNRTIRLVVLVVIGFLLAVAYQHAVAAEPAESQARAKLLADVKSRRARTDELQQRAERLRDEVARQRDEALAGTAGEARRLRDLEAGIGLAKVTGDGVVVRIGDAPAPVDPVTGKASGSNPGQVLDRDLQDVANALWRAGAEAIAVNGQRLSATTTIRAAGAAILVDFRPVTSPYEVAAIGPGDLDRRFNDSPTARRFRRFADTYRMQFSVRQREKLTLPAAPDPKLRFAHPPPPDPTESPSGGPSGRAPAPPTTPPTSAPPGGRPGAGTPTSPQAGGGTG